MSWNSTVPDSVLPRRFILCRDEDVSGLSGVGHVAEGCVFWDGSCAMRWRTTIRSTTVYGSVDELLAVHSHQGKTTIRFLDEPTRWCQESSLELAARGAGTSDDAVGAAQDRAQDRHDG